MKRRDGVHPALAAAIAATLAGAAGCEPREPKTGIGPATATEAAAPVGVAAEPARDAVLVARLLAALKDDAVTSDVDIQVSVTQRRARLSGFVGSAAVKLRAGAVAAAIEGIEGVENRLIQRHHAGIAPDPLGGARVHL